MTSATKEVVGVHPVGGVGVRWSGALWESAQQWCLENAECTGIMLLVGPWDVFHIFAYWVIRGCCLEYS